MSKVQRGCGFTPSMHRGLLYHLHQGFKLKGGILLDIMMTAEKVLHMFTYRGGKNDVCAAMDNFLYTLYKSDAYKTT